MLQYNGRLSEFPKEIKLLIGSFLLVLSIGFYTGVFFVNHTGATTPTGIESNYLGNEDKADTEAMQFKKGAYEVFTLVHNHLLSLSVIFLLTGGILFFTRLNQTLKLFLIVEPFCSVLLTFGGIFFMWKGLLWLKYVVMFSGFLMTFTYTLSIAIIFWQLLKKDFPK